MLTGANSIQYRLTININLLIATAIPTALYGCETGSLNAKITKRIEAFDTKRLRRVLMIAWKEKKTNSLSNRKSRIRMVNWKAC